MKALHFLLGAILIASCCARAVEAQEKISVAEKTQRERDATAAALVRLIAAQLPRAEDNWSVSYSPQYNLVDIKSNEPVSVTLGIGINGNPFEELKKTRINPGFGFHVQTLVSPTDYVRFKAENEATFQRLEQMQSEMKGIARKFDSFLPRNDAEKQKVEDYERIKRQLHSFPDFYFRDISLSWTLPYGNGIWGESPGSIEEKEWNQLVSWRREEEEIARSVLKILTRYESAKNK